MKFDRHKVGLLFDRPTRHQLVLAVVGSLLVALLEIVALATMVPLMQLLTTGSPGVPPLERLLARIGVVEQRDVAVALASVIFSAFLIKGVFTLGFRWWIGGFVARQQVRTSTHLLAYFLRADYSLHLKRSLAEFIRLLNDAVTQTYNGVVLSAISIVTEAFTIVAIGATLLTLAPLPALGMGLYFAVVVTLLLLVIRDRATEAGQRTLRTAQAMFGASVEAILSVKDIKLRDNAEAFLRPYRAARRESAQATRVATFLTDMPRYVLEIVFVFGVAVLTAVIFWFSPSTNAVSLLALFALGGFRILPSITRLMASLNNLRVSAPGFELVLGENNDAWKVLRHQDVPYEVQPFQHQVEFRGISFRYAGADEEVLHDIDLVIPAGMSVALVGGSGAGKTTLVDLLLGLHRPTSGHLLVDGVDIDENLRGWQQNLAMVPQSVVVIGGSVRENVDFGGQGNLTDGEILALLNRAQLGDWFRGLPEGLTTQIGDGGVGLSGGQRQRLGLARALATRPSLLVLDEATSALDNETERKITRAIEELSGQMTVVVVAHRLSTVRSCDLIVLMEQGRIEATGTFEELQRSSPRFARLVQLGSLSPRTAPAKETP